MVPCDNVYIQLLILPTKWQGYAGQQLVMVQKLKLNAIIERYLRFMWIKVKNAQSFNCNKISKLG
jgi:hypothetical protein